MRPLTLLLAAALSLAAAPALANPCGMQERGRIVVVGYAVGQTAIPKDQKPNIDKFAETAKFRDGVCVFAQVDKQGSKAANVKVADGRANAVKTYLISKGVKPESIKIGTQAEAFTFFGLLPKDQQNDRRVFVTHD